MKSKKSGPRLASEREAYHVEESRSDCQGEPCRPNSGSGSQQGHLDAASFAKRWGRAKPFYYGFFSLLVAGVLGVRFVLDMYVSHPVFKVAAFLLVCLLCGSYAHRFVCRLPFMRGVVCPNCSHLFVRDWQRHCAQHGRTVFTSGLCPKCHQRIIGGDKGSGGHTAPHKKRDAVEGEGYGGLRRQEK